MKEKIEKDSIKQSNEQDVLRELDDKMREFAKEREKLNKMSSERIALGQPLTDGEILEQNKTCSEISLFIMKCQAWLDEAEEE
ncbi:MAG: hypothetical protein RR956_03185 [Christensenella sp.]